MNDPERMAESRLVALENENRLLEIEKAYLLSILKDLLQKSTSS